MSATVGIIGLGSIGARHARELRAADAGVVALRRGPTPDSHGPLPFVDERYDPDEFFDRDLDAVIIANPTAMHIAAAGEVLRRSSCPVLIEKPLAVSASEADAIGVEARGRVRVAYSLRFHPVVRAVREVLSSGAIGRVLAGRVRFGRLLSEWNPGSDYRLGYAARRDLGGGALRTLSHELDLVQYWLGPVAGVSGNVGTVSDLEIDVDDIAQLSCRTEVGAMVAVEVDFLTPGYDRGGYLVGTEGRLDYSLGTDGSRLRVTLAGGATTEQSLGGADDMYSAQTRDLLALAGGGASVACTFDDAYQVLRIVEAVEQSDWLTLTPIADARATQ